MADKQQRDEAIKRVQEKIDASIAGHGQTYPQGIQGGVSPQAGNAMKHDGGKAPIVQGLFAYFPRALAAVADISGYGYEKYKAWGGWRSVPDAKQRYGNALGRHILAEQQGELVDPESKLAHAAHAAWNALAVLELALVEQKRVDQSWAEAAGVYQAKSPPPPLASAAPESKPHYYRRQFDNAFAIFSPEGLHLFSFVDEDIAAMRCRELDHRAANKARQHTYAPTSDGRFQIVDPNGIGIAVVHKHETAEFCCRELNAGTFTSI